MTRPTVDGSARGDATLAPWTTHPPNRVDAGLSAWLAAAWRAATETTTLSGSVAATTNGCEMWATRPPHTEPSASPTLRWQRCAGGALLTNGPLCVRTGVPTGKRTSICTGAQGIDGHPSPQPVLDPHGSLRKVPAGEVCFVVVDSWALVQARPRAARRSTTGNLPSGAPGGP